MLPTQNQPYKRGQWCRPWQKCGFPGVLGSESPRLNHGPIVQACAGGLLSRLPLWYLEELIVFADIEISTGVIDGQNDNQNAAPKDGSTGQDHCEAQAKAKAHAKAEAQGQSS